MQQVQGLYKSESQTLGCIHVPNSCTFHSFSRKCAFGKNNVSAGKQKKGDVRVGHVSCSNAGSLGVLNALIVLYGDGDSQATTFV